MLDETRKKDKQSLEELIAEINSTVNKVVGDTDEESEYIEEEKLPHEYRPRKYKEDSLPRQILPKPSAARQRSKRVKTQEEEMPEPAPQVKQEVKPIQGIIKTPAEVMLSNLLDSTRKIKADEENDFVKTE